MIEKEIQRLEKELTDVRRMFQSINCADIGAYLFQREKKIVAQLRLLEGAIDGTQMKI